MNSLKMDKSTAINTDFGLQRHLDCWLLPDGNPVLARRRAAGRRPMRFIQDNVGIPIKKLAVSRATQLYVMTLHPDPLIRRTAEWSVSLIKNQPTQTP